MSGRTRVAGGIVLVAALTLGTCSSAVGTVAFAGSTPPGDGVPKTRIGTDSASVH